MLLNSMHRLRIICLDLYIKNEERFKKDDKEMKIKTKIGKEDTPFSYFPFPILILNNFLCIVLI
jgi:hypothetical protein